MDEEDARSETSTVSSSSTGSSTIDHDGSKAKRATAAARRPRANGTPRANQTPEKSSGNLSAGSSPATSPDSFQNTSGSEGGPTAPADLRPEVAEMILHCAQWVAQHGPAFEKTLKEKNDSNPAFKFLHEPESEEGRYYQSCLAHERGLAIVKMSKQSAAKKGGALPRNSKSTYRPGCFA